MMYLTYTRLAHKNNCKIAYYSYLNDRNDDTVDIFCGPVVFQTCIIDIDELDACALALTGVKLFRVTTIENVCISLSTYTWRKRAVMADIDAVSYWWKHEYGAGR